MRMRSPNFMNGVTGLPLSIVSRTRRSAMQEQPTPASRLATVPEPTTVPASRCRVLRGMGDQLAEIEGQIGAGVGMAELLAVEGRDQRQVELAAVPGVAQLVGRHGDRREGGRGLAVEEAEALGQLGRR